MIAQPPQVILGHEMTHALANSEGTHRYGTDPSPPASEPGIEQEEAQAIGTGCHGADPASGRPSSAYVDLRTGKAAAQARRRRVLLS